MEKASTGRFSLPALKFDHLYRLTDKTGILEHSFFAIPDKNHGYTTDDNARALQVCLRWGKCISNREKLIDTYLKFLILAKKDNGFFNDLKPDLQWKNCSNPLGEHFGRAMYALAEIANEDIDEKRRKTADLTFQQMSGLIDLTLSQRTLANLIAAFYHRQKTAKNFSEIKEKTKNLADFLIQKKQSFSDSNWHWFEEILSYDNGRLPSALIYAYKILGKKPYLKVALETLDFLLETTFDRQKDYFSFPGNKSWFTKDGKRVLYGQQPVEAGSTVEACCLAFEVTREKQYYHFAKKALAWYHGENILDVSLVDKETGGVKDGIDTAGVNPNQGAESILSYLIAYHSFKKVQL